MAGEKSSKGGDDQEKSPWQGLLRDAAKQLIGVLITAGGLIGFVAFSGAVIVWTRFFAAKVPPDQAVNAVPTEELVAIGASLLLIFGFFGVLAVITMYLIDRGGRVTTGMSRALLLLLTIEGIVAIGLAGEVGSKGTAVAGELFLLSMGVLLWSTFSARFTEMDLENLTERRKNERDAEHENHTFRTAEETDPIDKWTYLAVLAMALDFAVGAGLITLLVTGSSTSAWMVGLPVLGIALALAILTLYLVFARSPDGVREALGSVEEEAQEEEEIAEELRAVQATPSPQPASPSNGEAGAVFKPPRLDLKLPGIFLVAAVFLIATVGPSLILGKAWIAVSLGSAAVLSAGLWRIGYLTAPKFVWYGLAVFISVPLFGTLTAMARNLEDPQVQPMAMIRNTDGPDEAIQGIYVTEAEHRVYFATAETEGCTNGLSPHGGRLLWVPRSEVVAMTVGPSQDVEEAANTALEMSYALTPGLGLPGRQRVGLKVDGGGGTRGASTELDKRLESGGAAVHPNFGSGLSLVPPDASPGQVVTLRVSLPNEEDGVEGFGPAREGRTLRVGGVPAPIIRERVKSASEAEFVKTEGGKVLALDKEGVYGRGEEGRFYLVQNLHSYRGTRYLKLGESSGAEANGALDAHGSSYLALESRRQQGEEGGAASLLGGQSVTLESGQVVGLETYLLQQGWHEEHIRFRVPEDASSGVVSVDCKQLAGQPVLDVSRPPRARIAVRMQAGSEQVSFDSAGSRDDESRIVSRRWEVERHVDGSGTGVTLDLPPRLEPYTVRLVVTDENGRSDSAQLRLARLPASLFGFDREEPENRRAIRRIGRALDQEVQGEAPVAVELDGHADEVGPSSYNLGLSLRRAERVRRELLPESSSRASAAIPVPVVLRAFGETCPLARRPGRLQVNRRVEVFLLGQGTTVASRPGCHVGREIDGNWRPPLR